MFTIFHILETLNDFLNFIINKNIHLYLSNDNHLTIHLLCMCVFSLLTFVLSLIVFCVLLYLIPKCKVMLCHMRWVWSKLKEKVCMMCVDQGIKMSTYTNIISTQKKKKKKSKNFVKRHVVIWWLLPNVSIYGWEGTHVVIWWLLANVVCCVIELKWTKWYVVGWLFDL